MNSTTARLGYLTLGVQAACLVATVLVYLVEHLHPGVSAGGLTATSALDTIGSIAVGGGLGGGLGTIAHGARHIGTAAPTSSMRSPQRPTTEPPGTSADEALTTPS